MRPLLLSCLACSLFGAEGAQAATKDDAPITPAQVQALIAAALKRDPSLWADYDLDRDGTVSQVEVVACLAKRPAWLREHLPEQFKAIDRDGDNQISLSELQAFASRAASSDAARFTVENHERTAKERSNLDAAGAAGQPGASIDASGGGTRAYAYFGQQQAYIAGYDVVNGQYDPVIGILGAGTVIDVGDVRITIYRTQH
jgi:hypothetical protein